MATNIDNMKSQMRKGMLEFCVLLLLSRNDAYVSEIISRMKEAHLIVVEGTLYPLMTRLKNDGLLNYRWEESPSGTPQILFHHSDGHPFSKRAAPVVEGYFKIREPLDLRLLR